MESDPRAQMSAIERAEAAPYVSYPPTPWWYFPVMGLWAAAVVDIFVWWRSNMALFLGSLVALLIMEGIFLSWLSRRHGALPMPGRGKPPAEIASVWKGYFVALPVIAAIVALVWWLAGVVIAGAVTFVLVTAGLAYYEHRYARAAADVRARLA